MRNNRIFLLAIALACLLCGCSMGTVRELYCLPKRSESYQDLQAVIDRNMDGLAYCAPLSGENRQPVQLADLDGDGSDECLLFARGSGELPLKILIFGQENDQYALRQTIEGNGTAYDLVEYVQMDDRDGMELVVGRQLNDQVLRSASVYASAEGQLQQLIVTPYTKCLTSDLDSNGEKELMILRPGQTETDKGIAELFALRGGSIVYQKLNRHHRH